MPVEPVTVLICALGGEGGGLLAQWITRAAAAEGMTVSATSVPGVAQRTGATSYYLELLPAGSSGQVLGLHPTPGRIDIVIASELVEAGRAMLRGFVTQDRTRLIASTHRVFTISERSAPEDGRVDAAKVRSAAKTMARETLLFDADALARASGARTNAVLLGALAGSGGVPISGSTFEAVLQADRATAAANIAGFRAGLAARPEDNQALPPPMEPPAPQQDLATLLRALPDAVRDTAAHGIARLVDYQGARHARTYLERLGGIAAIDRDGSLTQAAAKPLALLMSQEDVIRVAALKIAPERLAQIRRDLGAGPTEPCRIYEFLKPGLAEAVGLLPAPIGRSLMARVAASPRLSRLAWPIRIETSSPWGYLLLRLLAGLKPLRPFSYLHADRESLVERWLGLTERAARRSPTLAREVIDTATLIKGYASTLDRTRAAFLRVLDEVVEPAVEGRIDDAHMADAVLQARLAARRDDGGRALSALISALPLASRGIAA
jgi:indolepyruvate ferredoxin oxidoreductase beta subunit